jgi:uncharacterized FlgJ-related protein
MKQSPLPNFMRFSLTLGSIMLGIGLYCCLLKKDVEPSSASMALTAPVEVAAMQNRLEQNAAKSQTNTFMSVANAKELEDLFKQHDYSLDPISDDAVTVPEIYLDSLPHDFGKQLTNTQKKQLFVQTLLPFILDTNREILEERKTLLHYAAHLKSGRPLDEQACQWLSDLATKYRMKTFSLEKIDGLIERVDVIPVAMALGQAIEETGWGSSYAARIKNSVFGITLTSGVKAYENLAHSVKGYMLNLNANPAYKKMRRIRQELRGQGQDLCALKLMEGLHYYSELGQAYIRKVKIHITKNALARYEAAQLVSLS